MTKTKLKDLINRLKQVHCSRDETIYGFRSTRWIRLIPNDIDIAIEGLQEYLEILKD